MSTLEIFELVKNADYDQYTTNMQKGIKIFEGTQMRLTGNKNSLKGYSKKT